MSSLNFDYIIVGQGLAGSAVAIQLLKQNKKVAVFDQPQKNNSSRIATGLFNPITGQNMVKTWLADEIFQYLHPYYRDIEKKSDKKFFFPTPLYRPFTNIGHQNEWMSRSADLAYIPYIEEVFNRPAIPGVKDPFGGLLMKQCGYLDTTEYISAVRILIEQEGTLIEDDFQDDKVRIHKDFVQYGNHQASKLIFCQGVHQSKWFTWVPIKPSKGEIIEIRADFKERIILNRSIYMVPTDTEGGWRVGATYNFKDQTMQTTPEAREELRTKATELVTFPFTITGQQYGMRPTTHDRRPILGSHPEYNSLIFFNGLGTKGVSLAPYFSAVLVHWLENNGTINKEVDIERYKSVYWSSSK